MILEFYRQGPLEDDVAAGQGTFCRAPTPHVGTHGLKDWSRQPPEFRFF